VDLQRDVIKLLHDSFRIKTFPNDDIYCCMVSLHVVTAVAAVLHNVKTALGLLASATDHWLCQRRTLGSVRAAAPRPPSSSTAPPSENITK